VGSGKPLINEEAATRHRTTDRKKRRAKESQRRGLIAKLGEWKKVSEREGTSRRPKRHASDSVEGGKKEVELRPELRAPEGKNLQKRKEGRQT